MISGVFRDRLERAMKRKHLSPRQLAAIGPTSHRMIAYILAGRSVPTLDVADDLATSLGYKSLGTFLK